MPVPWIRPLRENARVVVTVHIGGESVTFGAEVSADMLIHEALASIERPTPALMPEDYDQRMARRRLMRVVAMTVEATQRQASWHALSKWLGLDPEKGF